MERHLSNGEAGVDRADESPIGIVVVGYGYWGPNLVRNISERPEFQLKGLCELDFKRAREFSRRYPRCPARSDLSTFLRDPEVEAVVVATPPRTHYAITRQALEAGKHALVEKPLATDPGEAARLSESAATSDLTLLPGHTFLYSPPVNKVRQLITSGEVGDVYFVTSSRMNLGLYQNDGVISDLAPHDLSILLYWLERPVLSVSAMGQSIFQNGIPETAFLTLNFDGDITANVQLSWLAPRKLRETVIVGSQRMIQYEDTSSDAAVRIYDRGLEFSPPEAPASFGEYRLTYRTGDMVAPKIDPVEPLALELEDFAHSIRTGEQPRSHATFGTEVVRVLNAAGQSMERGGEPVRLEPSYEWCGQWAADAPDQERRRRDRRQGDRRRLLQSLHGEEGYESSRLLYGDSEQ